MKNIVKGILRFSARLAVKRNNYKVVGITGSVGKTSTKKAVSLVLSQKYKVLTAEEGYNTEFGLPLILLDKKVPKSKLGWIPLVLFSPICALSKVNYDFCVLEMGADKPGDIEYLTDIAKPNIAVVSNIVESHLIDFNSASEIAAEKSKILNKLQLGDYAVLNVDNQYINAMQVDGGVKKITLGKKASDVKILGQEFSEKGSVNKFEVNGTTLVVKSSSLGEHLLYVFGSAIGVGLAVGLTSEEIIKGLESFKPVKGRLNLIPGLNESTLIDDSYNANPTSMKNALDVLAKFKGRRIAALGTMGDLGDFEKNTHTEIGKYLVGKCDILVTVGEAAEKYLAPSAVNAGLNVEDIHSFNDSMQAGDYLKKIIVKGDVVLLKGSQNASRMEKAVKILMKNPREASELLCRQGKEWEKK